MQEAFKNVFRALRYKNFRLFFIGQSISLIGTWMQSIALSWLVYRLTGSAFALGLVVFLSQIPSFLLSPLAGVVSDRWNRHRLLLFTQIFAMIQAFVLAVLTLSGVIAVWHIFILAALLGCVNSIEIPTRHSFLIDMVEKKEALGNAIALNSFMFNMAKLTGPSIAGIIIALAGEGMCFLFNGLSFLAVIWSLLLMKINVRKKEAAVSYVIQELKEGFNYTFGFAPIRTILLLISAINLMGISYIVLMPVFARDVLFGGPSSLGFLMSSAGVGALLATIFLASRRNAVKLGNIIPVSSALFSAGIIFFSLSRVLWVSMFLLLITGFGLMVSMATCNIILQTIADDDKRGRVMSFYTMSFMGMAPLGSLLSGTLAARYGAPAALMIGGIFCFLSSLAFAREIPRLKKMIHPIYARIEGISPVVSGIGTVTELTVPPED